MSATWTDSRTESTKMCCRLCLAASERVSVGLGGWGCDCLGGGMILQCCLLSSIDCLAAFDRHFLEVQLWVRWELPSSFQSPMDGCGQEFSDEQLGHVRGCSAHVMKTHVSLRCVGETVNHCLMCVIAVISQLFLRT